MKIVKNNVPIVDTGKKNFNNIDMVRDEKKIIVYITHLGSSPDQVRVELKGTAEEDIRQEYMVKIVYSKPDPPVTIEQPHYLQVRRIIVFDLHRYYMYTYMHLLTSKKAYAITRMFISWRNIIQYIIWEGVAFSTSYFKC